MEYKKGSIVEVLVSDGLFYNSWRRAEIVSGDGYSFIVRYNVVPGFSNKPDVEGVSVKTIRPCPPILGLTESWSPGDSVEVFHNHTWKPAVVLKGLDRDQFQVRATRVLRYLEVSKAEIRLRQVYQNGEWIILNKVCRDKAYEKRSRKFIVSIEEEESVMSSIGSCTSTNYGPYEVDHGSGRFEDIESHESDAESVNYRLTVKSLANEALCDGNHKEELYIYHSTMETLYAMGPLDWEKEAMVTNLRLTLHISNDEHLIMLKHLRSADCKSR